MGNIEEQQHSEITVKEQYGADFEMFCYRNGIQFTVLGDAEDERTYIVRLGMDYIDASIMVHKMLWAGGTEKDINYINMLVLMHQYAEVKYEYETASRPRKDERALSMFVG